MIDGSIITSAPIEPAPVETEATLTRLSDVNKGKFDEIFAYTDAQFEPEAISDEEIMEIASAKAEFYVGLFETDTYKALEYLGVPYEDTKHLTSSDSPSSSESQEQKPYAKRTSPYSAFGQFYDSIKSELHAVGATQDEIEEKTQELIDEYHGFSSGVAQDLTTKLERFKLVARGFGTPDLLRAEAKDASLAYLEELCTKIEGLGARPDKPSIAKRIGTTLSGRGTISQAEFDQYVTAKLDRFKQKGPDELLDDYVKNAMLYYAKVIYGQKPLIKDRGFDSDPNYLYDSFEATRSEGKLDRPLLPSDIVKEAVNTQINTMLFADGKWSQNFRTYSTRNRWRENERSSRERIFGNRKYHSNTNTNTGHPRVRQPVDKLEAEISRLDIEKQQTMIDFSRLVATIPSRKLDSSSVALIDKLKTDFLERLRNTDPKNIQIDRIIKTAMVELHPDTNSGIPSAYEMFQFYQLLRDTARSQN
ncbi:hypothetical protein KBB49_02230 [Candidatus Saccharibacteria bacterium]|jgi:hypothetical protein|nr:hypothetical protein [Candidatus Saccharibacteria bacterium]